MTEADRRRRWMQQQLGRMLATDLRYRTPPPIHLPQLRCLAAAPQSNPSPADSLPWSSPRSSSVSRIT